MRTPLACALACALGAALAAPAAAHAAGAFADSVRFVQYLDEGTALEEVRGGSLDLYYYSIPPDRIDDAASREGLQVFGSTGGTYSILVNPAESERLNPFASREARFALNYLVDRKLIVNELMGGLGSEMASSYGPHDPDYLAVAGQAELLGFRHNPALASEMISAALLAAGAESEGGAWRHGGEPVEVGLFIRSDDPVRASIGELLAGELEGLGLAVRREYGDLNKAFAVVYGSDPAELRWHLYTEGWGGRSSFSRYDSLGLGQMYAPWFSNMPGFNDPSHWNYENALLDSLTQRIYSGNFTSAAERDGLIREATAEGVRESVRVFLAGRTDQYVAAEGVEGVVNGLGAGVPGRFTPINARAGPGPLDVGVKQIYQGSWNPVMGLSDVYSTRIWGILHDPAVAGHPYTGAAMPVRAQWRVETAGPGGSLEVPPGAVTWDPAAGAWAPLPPGARAASAVELDLLLGDWHHGQPMDMNDVLYSVYFLQEWGSEPGPGDRTYDPEYTPRAAQAASSLVGVRPVDADTVEVYTDYWHFDESEIASRAAAWADMPWEAYAAMEEAVLSGRASFSRSGAGDGASWLSLIVPHDAALVRGGLESLRAAGGVPAPLAGLEPDPGYAARRYDAAIGWIDRTGHAVISNGPFYLERYTPESRTIVARAFGGDYPFAAGEWRWLEDARLPRITGADVPGAAERGAPLEAGFSTEHATLLHYFVTGPRGELVASGAADASSGRAVVSLDPAETASLGAGANVLRVLAVSDDVLRPDVYATSFLAADSGAPELPVARAAPGAQAAPAGGAWQAAAVTAAAAAAAAAGALLLRRRAARAASSP